MFRQLCHGTCASSLSSLKALTLLGFMCPQKVWFVYKIWPLAIVGCPTENMQNQSTAVFPSRSTIGKIETIPQMGMTLKMFVPNAILNQQC